MRWRASGRSFGRTRTILAVLTLVTTACVSTAPPPVASATAAADRPRGGRIIEGGISDIRTINPILAIDTPSGRITSLIYDQLVEADPYNGEPTPKMATFTQSPDGKTYTFEIDRKAVWSDGSPVIADDWYVAKKLVAMSKLTVRKSLFQDIEGWKDFVDGKASEISGVRIDSASPKRFTVTLSKVSCPAIFNIRQYTLPAHVFGKYALPGQGDAIDRAPENTAPTVFSGPFKLKDWRRGDQVILTRNDSYWRGAPYVDEYIYKVVADADVTATQLKTGELSFGLIDAKDIADMERQPHLRVSRVQWLGYRFIGWRTNSDTAPALRDRRVRQALAYGLDLDTVINTVLFGEAIRQVAHHVPVQWAYPDPRVLNPYPYDKAKAEALLREAGYARGPDGIYAMDGKRISFTIRTNAANKELQTVAQVASEQYRQIGIEAKMSFVAFQTLVAQMDSDPTLEALLLGWSLGPEPDPYLVWHSSQIPDPAARRTGFGFAGFRNAEVDRAIEEARNPSNGDCTVAARKKHYETFNRILNEEQPYNFGWSPKLAYVTSGRLQGFRPGSFGIGDVHEWWFRDRD